MEYIESMDNYSPLQSGSNEIHEGNVTKRTNPRSFQKPPRALNLNHFEAYGMAAKRRTIGGLQSITIQIQRKACAKYIMGLCVDYTEIVRICIYCEGVSGIQCEIICVWSRFQTVGNDSFPICMIIFCKMHWSRNECYISSNSNNYNMLESAKLKETI